MKKIKILFAVGRLSVGGAEKLLVYQLRAIDKEKFDPYLLTLFPETKESFANQVELLSGHWHKNYFSSLLDIPAWIRLITYLRREKFDAIVTSLFSANLVVRLASVIAGVPVIIAYEHNLYPDKRRWQILMDRLLSRRTHIIITDAESVKVFTAKQEHIPLEKFRTLYIPPLLDAEKLRDPAEIKKELGIHNDSLIALTVSRLVPEKGHHYLIEAAADVLKHFKNIYFILVGWGPLKEELKIQLKNLGIADSVLLPGRMDIQEMLPLADIYIEPAVNVDIGIALMEAMRTKKAIVATRVGEMPVFIHDGQNGILVPPRNSRAMADAVLTLIHDLNMRKRYGQEASRTVEKYSLEQYMRTLESIIKQALQI